MLANLDKLVVKLAKGSGGYGMLIGPHATRDQRAEFHARILAKPSATTSPSRRWHSPPVPTVVEAGHRAAARRPPPLHPQHGKDSVRIVPGGLTRVALRDGSLVVNSSQGGGTKDTWVLDDAPSAQFQSQGFVSC